jgi:hypothetical protein
MNVIISALALKFFFEHLGSNRIDVSTRLKVITYLGLLSPLGDYVIRFFNAEPLTQNTPVFFQSFFYQVIFWSFMVLFNWVIFRDLKRAVRYYSPVLGLAVYSLFTVFSTSKTPFLYPLIKTGVSFNLVNSGYLFPLGVLILFWIFKKVFTQKTKLINWAALSFMAVFVIFSLGTIGAIKNTLPEPFNKSEKIDIRPDNHFHTKWKIISNYQDKYYISTYQIIRGWEVEIQNQIKYQDIDLVQNLLMNPKIRSLYFNVFKNPVLNIEIQRENLYLEVVEPAHSFDLFWSHSAKIVLNNSGQIKTFQIKYNFLYWNILTINI